MINKLATPPAVEDVTDKLATPPPVNQAIASAGEERRAPPAAPARHRGWYVAAAAGAVVIGAFLMARSPSRPPASPSVSPAVAEPSERGAKVAEIAPPAPSAVVAVPSSAETPSPDTTTVLVKIKPVGARIYLRGKEVGRSPYTLELPRGERRVFEVGYPGYVTRRLVVDGSEPVISLSMAPAQP